MSTVFSGLIFVRILKFEVIISNFDLNRKKLLLLPEILFHLRGSVNYFVVFFIIFTEL